MGLKETKESVQQLLNIFAALRDGETILAGLEQAEQNAAELTAMKANLAEEMDALSGQRDDLTAVIDRLKKQAKDAPAAAKQLIDDANAKAADIIEKANEDAKAEAEGIVATAQAQADKIDADAKVAEEELGSLQDQIIEANAALAKITKNLATAKAEAKRLLGE